MSVSQIFYTDILILGDPLDRIGGQWKYISGATQWAHRLFILCTHLLCGCTFSRVLRLTACSYGVDCGFVFNQFMQVKVMAGVGATLATVHSCIHSTRVFSDQSKCARGETINIGWGEGVLSGLHMK